MKASGTPRERKLPPHWSKRVSAAYLRMQGLTQIEAARGVGRSERTLQLWEADREMWERARAEARDLWMNDAENLARAAVLKSVRLGNAEMGWRLLERIDRRLAPPTAGPSLNLPEGGVLVVPGQAGPEPWSQLAKRQQALVGHSNGNSTNGNGNGKHS